MIEFRGMELMVGRRNGRTNLYRLSWPKDLVPELEEFLKVSAGVQVAALRPLGGHFGKHNHKCKNEWISFSGLIPCIPLFHLCHSYMQSQPGKYSNQH